MDKLVNILYIAEKKCQVVFRSNFDTPKRATFLRDNCEPGKEKHFHKEIMKLSNINSKVNKIKSASEICINKKPS